MNIALRNVNQVKWIQKKQDKDTLSFMSTATLAILNANKCCNVCWEMPGCLIHLLFTS